MQTVETVEFYYTNRFLYYFLRICGMALLAGWFYWLFGVTVERHLADIPLLYTIVLVLYDIVAFLTVVIAPMLFVVKATHRKATAYFFQDKMDLHLWLHKAVIAYADVTQISWYWVQFGSSRRSRQKHHKNYRLKIWKSIHSMTVAASFLETNYAARHGGALSLLTVRKKLCSYTGQKAKDDSRR